MADYNKLFPSHGATGFSAKDGDAFHNYYIDVSTKMKNRELDMLIVVNMFLTGFDAKTLNTLWLDKNLKHHSLVQAFSRTNRILNSVKQCGNIVCFRDLEQATNDAIALFSDTESGGDSIDVIKIKTFEEYYSKGYTNEDGEHIRSYTELVSELQSKFPAEKGIVGKDAQTEFVKLFGEVMKRQNLLRVFDEYEDNREEMQIISPLEMQDYCSKYLDIHDEMKKDEDSSPEEESTTEGGETETPATEEESPDAGENDKDDSSTPTGKPTDDIVFELELLHQFNVDFDYILHLIDEYHGSDEEKRQPILDKIVRAIRSSESLRPKLDLIMEFIKRYDDDLSQWQAFVQWRLDEDVKGLAAKFGLDAASVKEFIVNAISTRKLLTVGPDFEKLMPPMDIFGSVESVENAEKRRRDVGAALTRLYTLYRDDYFDSADSSPEESKA